MTSPMAPDRFLVNVFTRLPVPGESKTRLIPALGTAGAADLQRQMTEHVVLQAHIAAARAPVGIEVFLTGGSIRAGRRWLKTACLQQSDGDLGRKLESAFVRGASRAKVTAVLGGDCPSVTAQELLELLYAASSDGASIIPASDGGFCALALRSEIAAQAAGSLEGVDWGTKHACAQTLERVRALSGRVRTLPERSDVDLPEDLPRWEDTRRAWHDAPRSLSVVVPTLNEAGSLPMLMQALGKEPDVRVIVSDGGSTDGTAGVARDLGAQVVTGTRGRGAQMNLGAAAADADALLFLHADTRPPTGFGQIVREALSQPGCVIGAFAFATDSDRPLMRLIESGTRLRGALLRMPYGDQGLFCRRAAFEALGGFPEIPVMEDYDFVRTARRAGSVRVVPQRAITSSRKWEQHGVARWTWLNMSTVARRHLGATPQQLAEWRRLHSQG